MNFIEGFNTRPLNQKRYSTLEEEILQRQENTFGYCLVHIVLVYSSVCVCFDKFHLWWLTWCKCSMLGSNLTDGPLLRVIPLPLCPLLSSLALCLL